MFDYDGWSNLYSLLNSKLIVNKNSLILSIQATFQG
jgi:hypothetical protein